MIRPFRFMEGSSKTDVMLKNANAAILGFDRRMLTLDRLQGVMPMVRSRIHGMLIALFVISSTASAVTWTVTNQWGADVWTLAGDFNGDGRTDIASAFNGTVYMKLNNGSGFTSTTWTTTNQWGANGYARAGDFDGDGKADIASPIGGTVYMKLTTGSGFVSQTWTATNQWGDAGYTFVGDYNGDGKSDFASASGTNVYMKLSTGSGFTSQTWTTTNLWGQPQWTVAGDFNGDGKTDLATIICPDPTFPAVCDIVTRFSTGSGFATAVFYRNADGVGTDQYGTSGYARAGKFNGDGKVDILTPVGSIIWAHLSFGDGRWDYPTFMGGSNCDPNWGAAGYTFVGDFDGDGRTDYASASGGSVYMKLSTLGYL